jgi:hypothetical protein
VHNRYLPCFETVLDRKCLYPILAQNAGSDSRCIAVVAVHNDGIALYRVSASPIPPESLFNFQPLTTKSWRAEEWVWIGSTSEIVINRALNMPLLKVFVVSEIQNNNVGFSFNFLPRLIVRYDPVDTVWIAVDAHELAVLNFRESGSWEFFKIFFDILERLVTANKSTCRTQNGE